MSLSFEIKRARGKTAVFSGARQHIDFVPRLEDLCIQKLLNSVNQIECVGDVPYYILRPILTKVSLPQLKRIESFNPQLVEEEESDEPWKAHCQRHFEGRSPNKGEKWRDLFKRCEKERDHQLEKITKRIKKHEEKSAPARQARVVADPQLPSYRNRAVASSTVITKTIKNHIPMKNHHSPSSSRANNSAGVGNNGAATTTSTVIIRRENANNGSANKTKAKTAPLMQKSMQLFRSRFRR